MTRVMIILLTLLCLASVAQARTPDERPSLAREAFQVSGDVGQMYRKGAIEDMTRQLGKVVDRLQAVLHEMTERALVRAAQRDWRRVEFSQYLNACPIPDERTAAQ